MSLSCILLILSQAAPASNLVKDVPAGHWAQGAVKEVVSRGVMMAPGGVFAGGKTVTRRELAIVLAAFGRALEKGPWPGSGAKPVKQAYRDKVTLDDRPVTRYELAAVLSRAARYIESGLPRPGKKPLSRSEAFPPKPKITLPRSDPAYGAVTYLISRDMAFDKSVALKPSGQPVTPKEVATALGWAIMGLNSRVTDEPQNRDEISPPPHQHRPRPK